VGAAARPRDAAKNRDETVAPTASDLHYPVG